MSILPYYLTPDLDQRKETARQKVAQQLILQGSSGEPVRAYTQGLARMAQGLLGGYELGSEEASDHAREAKVAQGFQEYANLNNPAAVLAAPVATSDAGEAPQAPPNRLATVLSGGATQPPQAAGSMYEGLPGWQPGERPLAETTGQAAPQQPPVQVAQAQPPAPTGLPVQPPAMPPGVAQFVAKWGQVPAMRPVVAQLIEKYQTPKEQYRPASAAERSQYGVSADHPLAIDIATNKPVFGPPQTNISLSTEKKGQEELASKAVGAYVDAQQAGRDSQKRIALYDRFEKAAEGFRPGASAELRLAAQRWAKDLGITAGDNVPEGEMMAMIGKQLAIHAQPKGQGSVSNYERSLYAQSLPTMTQTPEGLKMAIGIQRDLERFDQKTAQIFRDSARKNGGIPNYLEVQDQIAALGSPLSERQMAEIGGGKTETPAPTGGKVRRYNPQTGKIE